VPYAKIPPKVVDAPKHRKLALRMARESIVLLKNDKNILPLRKDLKSILVVGPNADTTDVLLGNYNGLNSRLVTILEGIVGKVSAGTSVQFVHGCDLVSSSTSGFGSVAWHAGQVDVVIAVMGLAPKFEGEEGAASLSEMNGDRINLGLPGVQEELLKKITEKGKPIVLVLTSGSAVAIPWAKEHVAAIVAVWYPGEEGGTAVADVLFGDYNPAGRLPVTFVKGLEQLPPFEDYRMSGRTYRFMSEEPLYSFGWGLSYTRFAYRDLKLRASVLTANQPLSVTVRVRNTGPRDGDEVVQLYVRDVEASVPVPRVALAGFRRVHLRKGQEKKVEFIVRPEQLALIDAQGRRVVEPGAFELFVGGGQPGTGAPGAKGNFTVKA